MRVHCLCVFASMGAFAWIGAVGIAEVAARAADPPATPQAAPAPNADEQAIRKSAQSFEAAYRSKDAKAIAALYAPDAELIDTEGHVLRGRSSIADEFQKVFEARPDARLTITINSLRLVAPGVAIEDGVTKLTPGRGQPPLFSRYASVQVKLDGQWLTASTRDLMANTDIVPISDRLKPLEFLIGDWVDESEDAIVMTSYRWGEDRQHITHDFTVKRAGQAMLKGSQRIGWDPLSRTIKSWTFDSRGGRSEGTWTWDRDHWLIKLHGVSGLGLASTATATLTPLGRDSYRWESTQRVMGSESEPDMTITVVRKPPEPRSRTGSGSSRTATHAKQGN